MLSESAVCAHDIPLSCCCTRDWNARTFVHAKGTRRRTFAPTLTFTSPKLLRALFWTEIYMPAVREPQWSVNAMVSLRVTRQTVAFLPILPPSSFLPSFLLFFLPSFLLFSLYLRYDIRQFDRATSDVRAVERKTNRISASFEFNAVASSARARDYRKRRASRPR